MKINLFKILKKNKKKRNTCKIITELSPETQIKIAKELPQDCFFHIMKFISIQKICKWRQVNKEWNSLMIQSLSHCPNINLDWIFSEGLTLNRSSPIETISLCRFSLPKLTDLNMPVDYCLSSLRELSLSGPDVIPSSNDLKQLLKCAGDQLRVLKLNNITPKCQNDEISESLSTTSSSSSSSSSSTLSLSFLEFSKTESFNILTLLSDHCPNLECLEIRNTPQLFGEKFGSKSISKSEWIKFAQHCQEMKRLRIVPAPNNLDVSTFEEILRKYWHQLEMLDLGCGLELNQNSTKSLFIYNKKLRYLNCGITGDDALRSICKHHSSALNFLYLYIQGGSFDKLRSLKEFQERGVKNVGIY